MNRALAFAATGGCGLALVSALGVLLAPLGYRLGVWDVRFALLTLVKWATIASLAALVVCLLAAVGGWVRRQRAGRGYAYVGVLLSVLGPGVSRLFMISRRIRRIRPSLSRSRPCARPPPTGWPTQARPWQRPNGRRIPTLAPPSRPSPPPRFWPRR